MNAANKLRGGKSELTRLKGLPADVRAEIFGWRNEADATNAALRARIEQRFGVALRRDSQLSQFWSWQLRQAVIDHLGMMMSQDERLLQDNCPGLTREQLREITIKRGYALADLLQDPKLGLKVAAVDLKDSGERREWEKYRDQVAERKSAIERELGKARSSGGITPETLEKIEAELKLL